MINICKHSSTGRCAGNTNAVLGEPVECWASLEGGRGVLPAGIRNFRNKIIPYDSSYEYKLTNNQRLPFFFCFDSLVFFSKNNFKTFVLWQLKNIQQ